MTLRHSTRRKPPEECVEGCGHDETGKPAARRLDLPHVKPSSLRAVRRALGRTQLDIAIDKGLAAKLPTRPARGWLAAVRSALSMTTRQLATRLRIRQPSLLAIEKSEVAGTVPSTRSALQRRRPTVTLSTFSSLAERSTKPSETGPGLWPKCRSQPPRTPCSSRARELARGSVQRR